MVDTSGNFSGRSMPRFEATPLVTNGGQSTVTKLAGYGVRERGVLRFGLPPGKWAVYLPRDRERRRGEKSGFHVGTFSEVTIKEGKALRYKELPPPPGRVSVEATDRSFETRYLTITGRTFDGFPVAIEHVDGFSGRYEIYGLPAGMYTLALIDRGQRYWRMETGVLCRISIHML